jgi:hypothetical protein
MGVFQNLVSSIPVFPELVDVFGSAASLELVEPGPARTIIVGRSTVLQFSADFFKAYCSVGWQQVSTNYC